MPPKNKSQWFCFDKPHRRLITLATVPMGVVLNLVLGTLIMYLKLPIFLDVTGTMLSTILGGIPAGIVTAILSSVLGGLLVDPVISYFTGTHVAIAIAVGLMTGRGFFQTIPKTIMAGVVIGVLAAGWSIPIVILSGGFTGSCNDVVTAALLAKGLSLYQSIFWKSVANEPLDKVIQCLLVLWLIRSLPQKLKYRLVDCGYLQKLIMQ